MFVLSLIDFVVIMKCYNSYLGYLTKISHLLQTFFLYMLCCLLIEGIKFLLRDNLLHISFSCFRSNYWWENHVCSTFFLLDIKFDEAVNVPVVYEQRLPHLSSIVQIRVVHSSWQSTYCQSTYCYVRHILCYSKWALTCYTTIYTHITCRRGVSAPIFLVTS